MKFLPSRLLLDYPQSSHDLVDIIEVSIMRRKQASVMLASYVLEHLNRTFRVLPGKISRNQHVAPAAGLLAVDDSDVVAVRVEPA